jgi:hypothetical protein
MALLDRSIEAVNTYLTYLKASDLAGTYTRWIRPFGVVDLKFFCYLRPPDDRPFLFAHPLHTYDRPSAREMGRYLARRGVNVAGAQLFPADPVVKRLMCAIDLFNLSFFSESFITLFALIDDLTQNVIRVGREKEGVSNTKADKLRKEAQQDRFVFYLGDMSKKLGWTSLFEEDPELGAMFTEVNTLRNSVMHSSTRLRRDQAFSAIETLLLVLERLQTNPFGYILPQLPVLRPAYPTFEPIPLHVGPENAGSPHGPRVGHSE